MLGKMSHVQTGCTEGNHELVGRGEERREGGRDEGRRERRGEKREKEMKEEGSMGDKNMEGRDRMRGRKDRIRWRRESK